MDMEISFPGGKRVVAKYDGFIIKTDQPITDGGTGSAPTPFDLFLVSIGTCTGFYILSFCKKNNIPTQKMTLTLDIKRNQTTHLVENIDINIHVTNDFPEKYKKAVVKAAEICSVKRNLQNPPKIVIKVSIN